MNDYISNANNIYIDLKDNIASFENEAVIIDELKCYLINFHSLEGFYYPDLEYTETGNGYHIFFKGLNFNIDVEDGMIVDYNF